MMVGLLFGGGDGCCCWRMLGVFVDGSGERSSKKKVIKE